MTGNFTCAAPIRLQRKVRSYRQESKPTNMVDDEDTGRSANTPGSDELSGLLKSHHEAAYGWVVSCCASHPGDAADVLQNTYQKILQGRARYSGASSFRTWLFAVIRNTAAEERRRRWIRGLRLESFAREKENEALSSDIGASPGDAEQVSILRRALAQLPRRQREILHLVFYQDFTIEAAAEVMRVSVGSARTHYTRGKRRLALLLKSFS